MTSTRPYGEHVPAPGCPTQYTRLYEPIPESGRDALWARLREEHGSVAPVEIEPGVRVWLLLGYQENLAVLQQPHVFSRDTRRWREVVEGRVDLSRPSFSWRPNALYADGAEHTRLRTPIVDALGRVDMATTERTVRRIADELVDSFIADGRADLVSSYAAHLPVLVVNSLYGLPDSYGHMLGDITSIVFDQDAKRGEEGVARMHQYFAGLVARKRNRPGQDLVSWMLQHPIGLSDNEVAHQAALINNSSHMASTHLIGNTMWTLLTDSRIRTAHTEALVPVQALLDHVMWSNTPFQTLLGRIALQDTRLGNAQIRAGDALLLGFAPAHLDPSVQRDDHGSDTGIAGGSRAHLMFGAGPHACPGRELARMIASTALSVLHERLSGLRLEVAPEQLRWTQSPFLRGLNELPVTFVPAAPKGPQEPDPAPRPRRTATTGPEEPEDLLDRLLNWWRGLRG
ncbi:cytochrome P450 [Nocardiopsis kunsanensis]|uniref:cytochrome P450 n=1 Tax=Nocardiopsis kunsanensis TaxID=141693 RepID=UPI0003725A3F|nr:cytochrome P450 [Nocardiopsis kunsanensis]